MIPQNVKVIQAIFAAALKISTTPKAGHRIELRLRLKDFISRGEGMGRQRKSESELRKSLIGVRLTESEREFLASEADVCGLSLSSLIRQRSLGKRVSAKADLRVLSELRRLGGLLKHLHNETKGEYSSLTSDCLKEIAAYIRNMNAELINRHREGNSR
jgi:hypothetical protein